MRHVTADVGSLGGLVPGGAIVTVAAIDALGAGYVSVTSTDAAITSVLNFPGGPGAVASMVVHSLSGSVLPIDTSTPAHLVVDVTAYLIADTTSVSLAPGPIGTGAGAAAPADAGSPHVLATGTIQDLTDPTNPYGRPGELLTETYSAATLRAGGAVAIIRSEIPGGRAAMVPSRPQDFPGCGATPLCIVLAPSHWDHAGIDPVDANRVMVAHEFAHVLSFRFQAFLAGSDAGAQWIDRRNRVNEECLADTVAATALARAGLPGNETAEYTVHYDCDGYWAGRYGADQVPTLRHEASVLAAELIEWADAWGAAHPT